MNHRQTRRRPVRIELTALVDVVLLLLIFFMVSARLAPEYGFEFQLPRTQNPEPLVDARDEVRVMVDARGRYFLHGEPVSASELGQRLSGVSSETTVLLEADEAASHGAVMEVIDAANRAGVQTLTLASERTPQS